MSYSFYIKAASKDDAGKQVEDQLTQVVAAQPVHERDRQAAQTTAETLVGLLSDPAEGEHIHVSVLGSMGWRSEQAGGAFTSAAVSVHARIAAAD